MSSQALSSQPFGYKKKPYRVYAVALYLLIAPWVYFVITLKTQVQEENWAHPSVWLNYLSILHPRVVFLLGLTLCSAVMLFLVRKASWILAITSLSLVILYNIFFFGEFPIPAIILLAFVCLTPFKKPYLNPSLRWWEQPPRFEVDLFASIPETQSRIHIYDISLGGFLGEYLGDNDPSVGATFNVELENGPKILCRIVRKQQDKYLGLHFENLSKEQTKNLKAFIKSTRRRGEALSKR